MAPGAAPISSPLPLAVPLGEPGHGEEALGPAGTHAGTSPAVPAAPAAPAAVLLPPPGTSALQLHYPCWLVDGAGGLVYRLQLDLRAIADSTSEHTRLLAFLQRRRPSAAAARDAAGITLRVLRGLMREEAPLPELRAAFDVVNGFAAEAAAAEAPGSRQSSSNSGSRASTPPPGGAAPRQPPPPCPVVTPQASQLGAAAPHKLPSCHLPRARRCPARLSPLECICCHAAAPPGDAASPRPPAPPPPQDAHNSGFALLRAQGACRAAYLQAALAEYLASLCCHSATAPPSLAALYVDLLLDQVGWAVG